jgi:hypothetical protein
MTRRALLGFLAGFVAVAAWTVATATPPAANAGDSYQGTWRIDYESSTTVDLELSYHSGFSSWDTGDTTRFDASAFHALTIDDVKSAKGAKHFQIVRDAGSFDCNGVFANGIGSGVFEFVASSAFADALDSRGLGRPDAKDQFGLALANVTLAMVDGLRSAGVTGLSAKALVKLANHDVNQKYVAGLNSNGVHPTSVEALVRLRDHDVQPDFIAGLARYGYHPGVDDLVRLRDHDVSLDFISHLQAHGYHPSVDDLIRLRDTGM